MKRLTLTRFELNEDVTKGVLVGPDFACFTIERPWLDNKPNVSCIPAGSYTIKRDTVGKYQVYRVEDVPDRTFIEFHVGNFVSDLAGCIALGEGHGTLNGYPAVHESSTAIKKFLAYMNDEDGLLTVKTFKVEQLGK